MYTCKKCEGELVRVGVNEWGDVILVCCECDTETIERNFG